MKWQPAPSKMVRLFEVTMQSLPEAAKRKMFGYPAAFANGHMFAGLHQDSFVLRLSPSDCAAFLRLPDSKPFDPMPGRTMGDYVLVPQALLNAEGDILVWLEKTFAYAASLPPKKPKAKGAR
ncbi:MAG: TfoX/Sxy family protein [Dehalococcoidia bacterium]|nr:TfoX/Sxy family protein [Dehalococcoidia bacterium]